ncbi:MAG: hypothetical protein JXR91_01200 [Deltaproteobacteria bacterium]|nr:hypothetical protein [Deltaproteobacteria bacterium]
MRRKRDFSHEIIIENVNINEDEKSSTAILTKILENRIRMRPSQWVWFHERWKSQNK